MKLSRLQFITVSLLILLFSCNKEAVDDNHTDLTGDWFGFDDNKTFYFSVDENSNATFQIMKDENTEIKKIKGVLRKKDEERLVLNKLYYFDLKEAPEQLDTMMVFVLHDYDRTVSWKMKMKIPKSSGGNELVFYK